MLDSFHPIESDKKVKLWFGKPFINVFPFKISGLFFIHWIYAGSKILFNRCIDAINFLLNRNFLFSAVATGK